FASALSNGSSFANGDHDAVAWYCRTFGYSQSASCANGDSIRCTSSRRGMSAPALTSESKPNAPPSLSAYQYDGGIHAYGPAIFMPEGPATVLVWSTAAETMGVFQ